MTSPFLRLATALLACLPLFAAAVQADPADPGAPAPALRHESAFRDYQPWQELSPGDWKALNAGGADAPAASGHAGHAGHGATGGAGSTGARSDAAGHNGHGMGHHHPSHSMPGGQK